MTAAMGATPSPSGGGHTPFGRALYAVLWVLSRTLGVSVFGVRTRFAEPLPARGGLLVLSTHQSHLDPLLLGLATDRRLSSLARSTLYRNKAFGAVITALDAVPIDRESSVVASMKAVIDRPCRRHQAGLLADRKASRRADRAGRDRRSLRVLAADAPLPAAGTDPAGIRRGDQRRRGRRPRRPRAHRPGHHPTP